MLDDQNTENENVAAQDETSKTSEITSETEPENSQPEKNEVVDETSKLREELAQTREQLKRLAAETENFRRRQENSFESRLNSAKDDLVARFLPFIDNLERAVKATKDGGDPEALRTGVELVVKDVLKTLDSLDVHPINALGETFDPNLHQAVMMEERTDVADETIVEEFKCGYRCGERVIRPSMVKVARNS